jgi:hypothetical protein
MNAADHERRRGVERYAARFLNQGVPQVLGGRKRFMPIYGIGNIIVVSP